MPATFKPDFELPQFKQIPGCSAWLLSLALEASAAGNVDLATAKLEQSARLNVAALEGSQSLVGHMITLAILDRHLHALRLIAIQHPTAAKSLQALPHPTIAQMAAAQRRWVVYEANFARSTISKLGLDAPCLDESGLGSLYCLVGADRRLPNYTEQLFSKHSQQVLESIRDDAPLDAYVAYKAQLEGAPNGLFGSHFHWRGTVPHILFDLAHPVYLDYFARSANTLLSAQATQLWLQSQSQAPADRAAWLAARVKDTPLASRFTAQPHGDWQLQTLESSKSFRIPTRWPAWP